jgi:hypothetical protein
MLMHLLPCRCNLYIGKERAIHLAPTITHLTRDMAWEYRLIITEDLCLKVSRCRSLLSHYACRTTESTFLQASWPNQFASVTISGVLANTSVLTRTVYTTAVKHNGV